MSKRRERGLNFFGHVPDRFSDPFSFVFFTVFRIDIFVGGGFVLQTCCPNIV